MRTRAAKFFYRVVLLLIITAWGGGQVAVAGTPYLAGIEDIKGRKIGVLLGSVHDTYVAQNYPEAVLMQYKTPSDLILAVKSGKVDAAFYTHEILLEIMRQNNDLGYVEENLFRVPIGMGFNQNNDELRQKYNTFMLEIKASGVFDDIVQRWIIEGNSTTPFIENPKNNGILVVGTVSDKGMPFAIVQDNKIVGFDIELAERFAASLGKEMRLVDMDFGSLIAAVATNKIDMVASTLMFTEERQKQIDFSEPYYELGASIFALKTNIVAGDGNSASSEAEEKAGFLTRLSQSFYSNIIAEKRYLLIVDGLKTTALISLFSVVLGTLLGALICYMRMGKNRLLERFARIYIAILRGIPVLVLLMLVFYVVFASVNIDPLVAAVLAFGMNFAAYVSEMFRSSIASIDKGQREAGIAGGFSPVQTFAYIIMPQAIRHVLPVYKGEFISLVKMTSVVGYIAVQDLTKAGDIIRSRTFDAFFPLLMVAVLYFLLAWLLTAALDYLEIKTDPKRKGQTGRAQG